MATIDRTAWTALVDDSGQNLDGSPWNKAAIKTVLLDPTDAAFGPTGNWIDIAFSAANFTTSGGGTWTVPGQTTFAYMFVGNKTIQLILYVTNTTITGAPVSLDVHLPASSGRQVGQPFNMFAGGAAGVGWALAQGPVIHLYRDILGTAWPAGSAHASGVFLITL